MKIVFESNPKMITLGREYENKKEAIIKLDVFKFSLSSKRLLYIKESNNSSRSQVYILHTRLRDCE